MAAHIAPKAVGAAIVLVVAAFRLLSLDYFENDHFMYLGPAHQAALGQLPDRDFDDQGFPLGIVLSAAALRLWEWTLLPEAVLTAGMLAIGAVLAWRAALVVSGVPLLALGAAALQVIAYPRLYSYPKILIGAAVPMVLLVYGRSPTMMMVALLAAATDVALLWRHDLAVYASAAIVPFFVLYHGWTRTAVARVGLYVGLCALFALPYLVYLLGAGFDAHYDAAVGFSRAEFARTAQWRALFASRAPLPLTLMALPIGAGAWLAVRRWRRGQWDPHGPALMATAVLMTAMNAGLMRDTTPTRAADGFGPVPVLVAWLVVEAARAAGRATSRVVRVAGLAAVVTAAALLAREVAKQGEFVHQLREGRLTEGWRSVTGHARRQLGDLRAQPALNVTQASSLEPVVQYLVACTTPEQSVLVVGYLPQLAFVARRRFAGGHAWMLPGYFESDADQRRMARHLERDPPAVAVIDPEETAKLAEHWPALAAHLDGFAAARRVGHLDVRPRASLTPLGVHASTGLPCYREPPA